MLSSFMAVPTAVTDQSLMLKCKLLNRRHSTAPVACLDSCTSFQGPPLLRRASVLGHTYVRARGLTPATLTKISQIYIGSLRMLSKCFIYKSQIILLSLKSMIINKQLLVFWNFKSLQSFSVLKESQSKKLVLYKIRCFKSAVGNATNLRRPRRRRKGVVPGEAAVQQACFLQSAVGITDLAPHTKV